MKKFKAGTVFYNGTMDTIIIVNKVRKDLTFIQCTYVRAVVYTKFINRKLFNKHYIYLGQL